MVNSAFLNMGALLQTSSRLINPQYARHIDRISAQLTEYGAGMPQIRVIASARADQPSALKGPRVLLTR